MISFTSGEISQALDENRENPAGAARSVRAEQLVEAAAQLGDRPLLIQALQELIRMYEFGGEGDKIMVPFARVLQMWDDDPSDFDQWAVHSMFWHFKWVTSGMIVHPNVGLESIKRWLDEMGRRYRQAGHGSRAVHAQRHYVASHIGDIEAAQNAFDGWLRSDRDIMSDCHACEHSGQGDWYTQLSRDDQALQAWQPVLGGDLTCTEEPHRVLAKSLLPLVRLGRLAEARGNHLRGYRLVRGNPSLRRAVGQHIEFAALTGNEPRGLEILADHATWLERGEEDAFARLTFLTAVAVLLRRLIAIGHAELPIAYPGAAQSSPSAADLRVRLEAEIADLARAFDARNGTTAVSGGMTRRLDAPTLVESLPLGARGPNIEALAQVSAQRVTEQSDPDALESLVAAAVSLSEAFHPDAARAWARVSALGDLPPWVTARVAESRAVEQANDSKDASAAFIEVAERFAALDDPVRATLNRSRAALATSIFTDMAAGSTPMAAALADIRSLRAGGRAGDLEYLSVLLFAMREAFRRWVGGVQEQQEVSHGRASPASPDVAVATASPDFGSPSASAPAVGSPSASAPDEVSSALDHLQARLDELTEQAAALGRPYFAASAALVRAQVALTLNRADGARTLLAAAVADFLAAHAPWSAALPLAILSGVSLGEGDLAAAEANAREGLRHGGSLLAPELSGRLTLHIADACWQAGERDNEVIDQALAAAGLFDRAGPDHAHDATNARVLASFAFRRTGRPGEAAALLEDVLPDLEGHEVEHVRAQRSYGLCLDELGEHRDAARVLLAAATKASAWPEQNAHASLAHEAGSALEKAGMVDEAERAYEKATDLWRLVGEVDLRVRAIRAGAWLRLRRDEPDHAGAISLMERALEIANAPAGSQDEAGVTPFERFETLNQMAQMRLDWANHCDDGREIARRGVEAADAASVGFTQLDYLRGVSEAEFAAAQLEITHLGQPAHGFARVRALRAASTDRGDAQLAERCAHFLRHFESGDVESGDVESGDVESAGVRDPAD